MSYLRTQEILESQMEMLYGRLCKIETEGERPFGTDMIAYYAKAIRETAKTLLGYYTLEAEPMPPHIAEGVRELDAEDAATVEAQRADRLHDDLVKLGERLDATESLVKFVWEICTSPFFGLHKKHKAFKF